MRVAAILVFLTSCAMFTRSIEKPTAEVRSVQVGAAGFTGLSGELRLDVSNPNGFGVPLAGIDWQLAIGGGRAVSGAVELHETIPAHGVAPVATTLRIDAREAIAAASALNRGERGYQLRATLHFSTPVGRISVDIEHSGQLGSGLASRFVN